jgi:hypothetical protein
MMISVVQPPAGYNALALLMRRPASAVKVYGRAGAVGPNLGLALGRLVDRRPHAGKHLLLWHSDHVGLRILRDLSALKRTAA